MTIGATWVKRLKMSQNENELTPQQTLAIPHLLHGRSITETADLIGVARQTVSRWLHNDPAFIAAYNAERLAVIEATRSRIINLATVALDVLEGILKDEFCDYSDKLKAAGLVAKLLPLDALPIDTRTNKEIIEADQNAAWTDATLRDTFSGLGKSLPP